MVVLAALAGMVAAIGPARRAAKLNVLKAIVST
jgi:ABC-type antimicrobial peptide transport system permease subunit